MGADPDDDEPFWVLDPDRVLLWIAKGPYIDAIGRLDVIFSPTPDEHWLPSPLDSNGAPRLDAGEINLDRGKRKDVFASRHAQNKLKNQETDQGGIDKPPASQYKVGECTLAGVARGISLVIMVVIHDFRSGVFQSGHSRWEIGDQTQVMARSKGLGRKSCTK